MQKLRAYLQLLRFPAVFSAMSNIALGYLLWNEDAFYDWSEIRSFLLLLGSSSCLYLSGMALNDLFDRHEDSVKRPGRPIPSGRVSVAAATLVAMGLMAIGLLLAAVAGIWSLAVAVAIAIFVLLYDGLFKNTLAGPILMGACRSLNVLLGASGTGVWKEPETGAAIALGIYIVGVTYFARREEEASDPSFLAWSAMIANAGLLLMGCLVLFIPRSTAPPTHGLAVVAFLPLVFAINKAFRNAIRTPTPELVQAAVKRSLLSIILLDATLILARTGRIEYALMTALLLIPSYFIAKWIYVT
ncbi:MAG: UbiA family prenyltransferase [Planctomycetaceae bacterium]